MPVRSDLERDAQLPALSPVSAVVSPVMPSQDRQRLDLLFKIDAYVGDDGSGLLEIQYHAMKKLAVSDEWIAMPHVQMALLKLRGLQQEVTRRLASEAEKRPLDFAKAGSHPWPRDLPAQDLARLDRWALDRGFQHDMFALEQRIYGAHQKQEARQRDAQKVLGAPSFAAGQQPPAASAARVRAFDRSARPTQAFLMLVHMVGEQNRKFGIAEDGRILVSPSAPPLAANLVAGLLHDPKAAALVGQTLRASRAAGKAVWPPGIAAHLRAYAQRINNVAQQPHIGGREGPGR